MGPRRYRWYHAVLFWLLANSLSFRAGWGESDRRYYEGLKGLPVSPPGAVFVPVWLVNNASTLWGNLRTVNRPPGAPGRTPLLALQGVFWFFYATFGQVYFTRRSPILGFIWTFGGWVATVASVVLALRTDRAVALSLGTTLAWESFATVLTAYQARHNPDAVFGYRPAGVARTESPGLP